MRRTLAFCDGGISKGPITVGSLMSIVPADSREDILVIVELTGTQLLTFFEEVAYINHTGRGGNGTGPFGPAKSPDIAALLAFRQQHPLSPLLTQ